MSHICECPYCVSENNQSCFWHARVAELEADLRDTKDTLEAVKHSNRSLEAEVEKEMWAKAAYLEKLEEAEAERDRLKIAIEEYIHEALRAALEGKAE